MGIVIRQSIKTISITITGAILGIAINLLSMKFFSKTELGFTQNLIKIALMLSYFCMLGFYTTLVVYGQKYPPGHPKRKSFLSLSIIIPAICTGMITCLYYILKPHIINAYHSGDETLVESYFILFPLLTILTSILLWMEFYLQSIFKTAIQSLGREIINRVIYIALILLYAYQILNYDTFIWWYVILYIVPILFLGYHIKKNKGFEIGYNNGDFSKKDIIHIIAFSFNQTFVVISIVLIAQIDSLLIGPLSYDGLEAIAVYSMATFGISIIKNPIRALSAAALPALSKNYQEISLKELRKNYMNSVVSIQMLVIFCTLGFTLCINEIQYFINIIKPGYEMMGKIILILLVGNAIDMMGGLNMEVITLSKYFKKNTTYSFISLGIIILLIYLTIENKGLYGVAWSSTIGLLVYAFLKSKLIYNKFRINPYTKTTATIAAIAIIAFLPAHFIINFNNTLLNLILKGSIYTTLFITLCIKLNISIEINNLLYKYLPFLRPKKP